MRKNMLNMNVTLRVTLYLILFQIAIISPAQKIVFVNHAATGLNNGSTWGDAYTNIQDAINDAFESGGGDVWVAEGTYKPTEDANGNTSPSNSRDKCFTLKSSVTLYGGFQGGELLLEERNWLAHTTTLSGEIGSADKADNCKSVVYANITGTKAGLNGFTITRGYAQTSGGGANVTGVMLINNIFIDNHASQNGGGIYASNTDIIGCEFKYNDASSNGGAMYLQSCFVDSCEIRDNNATNGAGFFANSSVIQYSTIFNNNATSSGGGASVASSSQLIGCRILNNRAANGGGLYMNGGSNSYNCLLTNNSAQYGGGIYFQGIGDCVNATVVLNEAEIGGGLYFNQAARLINSVCWSNSTDIYNENETSSFFNNATSLDTTLTGTVEQLYSLEGEILVFQAPYDSAGQVITANSKNEVLYADWQPIKYSRLIDLGQNGYVHESEIDINKKKRILNSNRNAADNNNTPLVDLGAYEAKANPIASPHGIIYIKNSWCGTGDGSSWENATDELQYILDESNRILPNDTLQIWVERGILYPNYSFDLGLYITKPVYLYGGFIGNETSLEERNVDISKTMFSADIGIKNDITDNRNRILLVRTNATIDGFIFYNAKERAIDAQNGAVLQNCEILSNGINQSYPAVYLQNSTLRNCSIHDNMNDSYSNGAIYATNSLIDNCKIYNNYCKGNGGGLYIRLSTIRNSNIYENEALPVVGQGGGGLFADASSIVNCLIHHNNTSLGGGGAYLANGSSLMNCTVFNNTSGAGAGGVSGTLRGESVKNSFIYNNSTSGSGGGIANVSYLGNSVVRNNVASEAGGVYNCQLVEYSSIVLNKVIREGLTGGYFSSQSNTLKYSILWGNQDNSNSTEIQIYQRYGDGIIAYCGIQGGYSGYGNINLSADNSNPYGPRFTTIGNTAGISNTEVDLHILGSSILVDRAVFDSNTPTTDIEGNCRVIGDSPDIGAYEFGESAYENSDIKRIYVTETGDGNGTSWQDAMSDLNKAIYIAKYVGAKEVWVAQGLYYPNLLRDRSYPVNLKSGVNVYGGFKGTERFLSERVPGAYISVISGDLGRIHREYDNSYNLIYYSRQLDDLDSAMIDGFTLQDAYQNNEPDAIPYAVYLKGGTIQNCTIANNINTALKLENSYARNCIIENNTAITNNINSPIVLNNSTIDSCIVRNNEGKLGGGCYANHSKIKSTIFHSNSASVLGGAICARNSNLWGNTIFNNDCDSIGGGIYSAGYDSKLSNLLITNNSAKYGGGLTVDTTGEVYGLTIANNKADSIGGGIYYRSGRIYNTFKNTLLWGNKSPKGTEIYLTDSYTANPLENSAIADTVEIPSNYNSFFLSRENWGADTTALYPHFVYPTSFAGIATDIDYEEELFVADWSLSHSSHCIDKGKLLPNEHFDIYYRNRSIDGNADSIAVPDIGAFEMKTLSVHPSENSIIYLSSTWKGTGDGSSWGNARDDIQDAIDKMNEIEGGEAWIAKGEYKASRDLKGKADSINLREKSFVMKKHATLYGGFQGNETSRIKRNILENKTILSAYPLPYEKRYNSYHVIYAPEGTDSCVVNGCFLLGGNANHFREEIHQQGGGALMHGGDLVKCIILNNRAYNEGAGAVLKGNARMLNCIVSNNTSYGNCGGIAIFDSAHVDLSTIVNNVAKFSFGGMCLSDSATLTNSVVWGNEASGEVQLNSVQFVSHSAIESDTSFSNATLVALSANNNGEDSSPSFKYPSDTVGIWNSLNVFVNIPEMNWGIRETSTLIDKGNIQTEFPELQNSDISESNRLIGEYVDIGAYEFSNLPVILNNPSDIILCEGGSDSTQINAQGENLNYSWQYNAGIEWKDLPEGYALDGVRTSKLVIPFAQKELTGLSVRCRVFNSGGSVFTEAIYIEVHPIPEINMETVIHLCEMEELTLPNTDINTIEWSTGETSPSIIPSASAWYSVSITDFYGCQNSDSMRVFLHDKPEPPFEFNIIRACSDDRVWLNGGDFNLYSWNDGSSSSIFVATSPGTYWLKGTDDYGCSVWDTVEVLMHTNPTPELQFATYSKNGGEILLVWNTLEDEAVENVHVFRSPKEEFEYTEIGVAEFDSHHWYIDNSIDNGIIQYAYSIQFADTCSTKSAFASPISALHLDAYRRASNPQIVDLLWEVFPNASEYKLLRGTSPDQMQVFATVSSETTYFETTADEWVYFAVAVPLATGINLNGETYNNIYSNQSPIRDFVSVENTSAEIQIEVFPNPFADEIFIQLPETIEGKGFNQIKLFDSRSVFIASQSVPSNQKLVKVNCSDCLSGIYIIQVISANGEVYTRMAVKN